ncbi:acid protease [Trametes coccinea BRFM310]|uniref:Acid protease n=1 Tax=Trametes coccinea (strain BRFM310) TaxID=1353009 RepID=A0A1Y2IS04_TRAC3|nr:acid protease [Trametes coccinea BRFM310]
MLTISRFTPLVGLCLSSLVSNRAVSAIPFTPRSNVHTNGLKVLATALPPDNVGVVNHALIYTTNITVGGTSFLVQLDTGSSDLWLNLNGQDIDLVATSNIPAQIQYGSGGVSGNVQFADVQLGDLVIESQAFIDATKVQDVVEGIQGIIGLGFNNNSNVWFSVAQSQGVEVANDQANTAMTSLFLQRTDIPPSFDIQLGRASAEDPVAPGVFLIGEHDQDFQSVVDAPPLPVVTLQHWSVAMDGMNVNGSPFKFNASTVPGVPEGKLAAQFDTGFTFPPIPPAAIDAIYSSIPGAILVPRNNSTSWIVPCNASANVSFVFAGQEFFVHPLDLTIPTTTLVPVADGTQANRTICINTFQYFDFGSNFGGFDLILGEAFLRNVYASFNFGDNESGPFVQLVSTTPDLLAAYEEFATQRAAVLAQLPPTLDLSETDQIAQGGSLPAETEAQPNRRMGARRPSYRALRPVVTVDDVAADLNWKICK